MRMVKIIIFLGTVLAVSSTRLFAVHPEQRFGRNISPLSSSSGGMLDLLDTSDNSPSFVYRCQEQKCTELVGKLSGSDRKVYTKWAGSDFNNNNTSHNIINNIQISVIVSVQWLHPVSDRWRQCSDTIIWYQPWSPNTWLQQPGQETRIGIQYWQCPHQQVNIVF